VNSEKTPATGRFPTYPLFLPRYCALSLNQAASTIVDIAGSHTSFGVTALAVHGLIESIQDPNLGGKINQIAMIVPDGQPVVWALNALHQLRIPCKVPGPDLTLAVLEKANQQGLKIFLFGSTADTLQRFCAAIGDQFPGIEICGVHEDRFREATAEEDALDVERINHSGAHIVLVGRGCPRQEHWVADHVGGVNAVMMAVGAAFDYHAGKLTRAPMWIQRAGLEWLYRLVQEPRRLWRRYLVTNSWFIWLYLKHRIGNVRTRVG